MQFGNIEHCPLNYLCVMAKHVDHTHVQTFQQRSVKEEVNIEEDIKEQQISFQSVNCLEQVSIIKRSYLFVMDYSYQKIVKLNYTIKI